MKFTGVPRKYRYVGTEYTIIPTSDGRKVEVKAGEVVATDLDEKFMIGNRFELVGGQDTDFYEDRVNTLDEQIAAMRSNHDEWYESQKEELERVNEQRLAIMDREINIIEEQKKEWKAKLKTAKSDNKGDIKINVDATIGENSRVKDGELPEGGNKATEITNPENKGDTAEVNDLTASNLSEADKAKAVDNNAPANTIAAVQNQNVKGNNNHNHK